MQDSLLCGDNVSRTIGFQAPGSLSVAQGASIAMRQIQSCSLERRMELPDDDGDALLAALQPPESDDDGDVAAAIQNAVQRAVPPAAGPDGRLSGRRGSACKSGRGVGLSLQKKGGGGRDSC